MYALPSPEIYCEALIHLVAHCLLQIDNVQSLYCTGNQWHMGNLNEITSRIFSRGMSPTPNLVCYTSSVHIWGMEGTCSNGHPSVYIPLNAMTDFWLSDYTFRIWDGTLLEHSIAMRPETHQHKKTNSSNLSIWKGKQLISNVSILTKYPIFWDLMYMLINPILNNTVSWTHNSVPVCYYFA